MIHKLRIIVAVTCLLATACFVILWMRSARQWDTCMYSEPSIGMLYVESANGMFRLGRISPESSTEFAEWQQGVTWSSQFRPHPEGQTLLPKFVREKQYADVYVPYWLLIASSALFGTAIYFNRPVRFRFSLGTLAIAATLIVLTLGLGVAASRLSLG